MPQSLPSEDRVAFLNTLAEHSEQHFQETYFQLADWFTKYDALYVLSFCCLYFLSHPEGTDPEVKGALDFYPFHLEILQAFSLTQERLLVYEPLGEESQRLKQVMKDLGHDIKYREMLHWNADSEYDINQRAFLQSVRTQTTAVRNWAYLPHMRYVTKGLAESIRQHFTEFHSIDPVNLVDALFTLAYNTEERFNEHISWLRKFFHETDHQAVAVAYFEQVASHDRFDPNSIFEATGHDLNRFKAQLLQWADFRLPAIFTFSIKEIAEAYGAEVDLKDLQEIFDKLSIQFGDLADANKEYFVLDNPVWKKPFIKIDSNLYFSVIIGFMPHYALGLLEALISDDTTLEPHYRSRKGRYLEEELEKLFQNSFPGGQTFRGSLWQDNSGKQGENDLTTILDTVAIVVEAKSGQISAPASRGAPDRLRRTVRELIEDPAEQANNFIQVLRSLKEPCSFHTSQGSVNTIDARGIRYYIPITVTLDQFGSIGNLKRLTQSGISSKSLSELSLVISLTDLMVIFDLLELQSEKVHYLARRKEFDTHTVWHGDEIDILAFYLDHGFNIGEDEFSGGNAFGLWLKSKELDPYYLGQDAGVALPKPRLALTERWRHMLHRLDLAKADHWLEASLILLNVQIRDQEKFERLFSRLCSRVRKGRTNVPHESLYISSGPPQRRFALIFYPYIDIDRRTRDKAIAQLLNNPEVQEARGALCIGIDLRVAHLPYSLAALKAGPNLFDEL